MRGRCNHLPRAGLQLAAKNRVHVALIGRHVRLVTATPPVVRTVDKQLAVPSSRAEGGATHKVKLGGIGLAR
jgi:hypothetical protein